MARFDFGKALRGGASGALSTSTTANPWIIGGNTALQALLAGFSGREKFDASPFRARFADYKQRALDSAGPAIDERGSAVGQLLNSRGLGNSPLAAGITGANRRQLKGQVLSKLLGQEYALEHDLGIAEFTDERQRSSETRREILGLVGQSGGLALELGSPDEDDASGIRKLRDFLNLPNVDAEEKTDYEKLYKDSLDKLNVGGESAGVIDTETGVPPEGHIQLGDTFRTIDIKSGFGVLYSKFKPVLDEIVQGLAGGWDDILDIFDDELFDINDIFDVDEMGV